MLVLNIGTKIFETEDVISVSLVLNEVSKLFNVKKFSVHEGQYLGKPENTVVILAKPFDNNVERLIGSLCINLYQDCIAYKDSAGGKLVYHPNKKYTEKLEFNEQFFINK